jgi:hypothetical protein
MRPVPKVNSLLSITFMSNAADFVDFLSLKYHRLHPEYLHNRIERLRGMYLLRVLLLICDIVSGLSSRNLGRAS